MMSILGGYGFRDITAENLAFCSTKMDEKMAKNEENLISGG